MSRKWLACLSFMFCLAVAMFVCRDVATVMGVRSTLPYRTSQVFLVVNEGPLNGSSGKEEFRSQIVNGSRHDCAGTWSCGREMCALWRDQRTHFSPRDVWITLHPFSAEVEKEADCPDDLVSALNHLDGAFWAWSAITGSIACVFLNGLVLCLLHAPLIMMRVMFVLSRICLFLAVLSDVLLVILMEDKPPGFAIRGFVFFSSVLLACVILETCMHFHQLLRCVFGHSNSSTFVAPVIFTTSPNSSPTASARRRNWPQGTRHVQWKDQFNRAPDEEQDLLVDSEEFE